MVCRRLSAAWVVDVMPGIGIGKEDILIYRTGTYFDFYSLDILRADMKVSRSIIGTHLECILRSYRSGKTQYVLLPLNILIRGCRIISMTNNFHDCLALVNINFIPARRHCIIKSSPLFKELFGTEKSTIVKFSNPYIKSGAGVMVHINIFERVDP